MMVQSKKLAALRNIRHAFFTREGGVSEGIYASLNGGQGSDDRPEHVAENRRRMAEALQADALITAYQIHSPNAVIAERAWARGAAPKADAIVTKTPALAVGVGAADCGPVLFADDEARVVASAHAGWKGAFEGVIESALTGMERLGAQRSRIVAAIGPLIRQQSYEVGAEFVERFTAENSTHGKFFIPSARAGHSMFDLPGFVAAKLTAAGVGEIDDLGLDTYSDEQRFYSYRRTTHRKEPDYGRLIGAICIVR